LTGSVVSRGQLDELRGRCPGSRRRRLLAATSSLRSARLGATRRLLFRRAGTGFDRCGPSSGHGSASASTQRTSEALAWLHIRPSGPGPEATRQGLRDFLPSRAPAPVFRGYETSRRLPILTIKLFSKHTGPDGMTP